EVSRNRAYVFAAIWPRMFPVPPAPGAASAPAVSPDDLGTWHESVVARAARAAAFTFVERLERLPATDDIQIRRGDTGTAGSDTPDPDPRERPWRRLGAGEVAEAVIRADVLWNPTGIVIEPGATYRMTADGTWVDLDDVTDPGGRTSLGAWWADLRWRR